MNRDLIHVYTVGPVSLSVCAPHDVPIERVTFEVNLAHPTGVGPWTLSDKDTFASGEPHPCVCERDTTRRHYLFNC